MIYTEKAINKANSLVGEKCKIYYPWRQRYIYRKVYKDDEGYYILYRKEKKRLRLALNDFEEMIGFEVIH